jgi:hypothetical protein
MLTKFPASRSAILAGGGLFIAVFVALTFINWMSAKSVKKVMLVYVGAENCAPCDS